MKIRVNVGPKYGPAVSYQGLVRYGGFLSPIRYCQSVDLLQAKGPNGHLHSSTRSSAIAEGPRDASCQLKFCQLPRNSAETTYTTSPGQIDGMKLEV